MCDFVIVGFAETHSEVLRDALPEGIYLSDLDCPAVAKMLPKGHAVMALVTENRCSCGLYFNSEDVRAARRDANLRQLRARAEKYRNRGWSAAKIQRALADSASSASDGHDLIDESKLEAVEAALSTSAAQLPGGLFVLVHEFSGSSAEEQFKIRVDDAPREHVELRPRSLAQDRLVHLVAGVA